MNFNNLIELTQYFSIKENCIEFLKKLRWENDEVKCVFCNISNVKELNGKNKRFRCANCKHQFSIIKGTIFENSQIPLQKWFVAIYISSSHKKGISSVQLSKDLGVTQKTAWFMLQRIRYAMKIKTVQKMDGVIQADETYIGGKNKNRVDYNKIANSQGRSLKDKTPVFGLLKVGGDIQTQVIPNAKSNTIKPIIENIVESNSIIVTDEWKAYKNMPQKYYHVSINHKMNEFVKGAFHTNSIEGFWSLLKRGILGIYHQVSPKHLHRYCDEFVYRYNTKKMNDGERFNLSITKINCRLQYKELIG